MTENPYEKCVLAMLIIGQQEAMDNALDMGLCNDCFTGDNKLVFNSMLRLYKQDKPFTEVDIASDLKHLEGIFTIINDIASAAETDTMLSQYVPHLVNAHRKDKIGSIIERSMATLSTTSPDDLQAFLEQLQSDILNFDAEPESDCMAVKEVATEVATEIELPPDKKRFKALRTGLDVLDAMIEGYYPCRMVVIAGRPATGKTSVLLSSMLEMAMRFKTPCLFFSYEMSKEEIVKRLVGMLTNLPLRRVIEGELIDIERVQVQQAFKIIKALPIYIVENQELTIEGIERKIRQAQRKYGIKFVGIDYLQLIQASPTAGKRGTRESEIAHISRGIKKTAMALEIPIVILAQLNREVEKENRKPRKSDLRDSGSIEQDADQILLLSPLGDQEIPRSAYEIEIIKDKDRHGASPMTRIAEFNKMATRYQNPSSFYIKKKLKDLL